MSEIAQESGAAAVERHYGLDWLRIGAFALLIPYHIGMFFTPGQWVVKTLHPVAWVSWPLTALRPWRLSLLFLVSGYASRALMSKLGGTRAFVRSRSLRLLLPLAFGTLVIVAPQAWVRLAETGYAGSFWHFWWHDRFTHAQLDGVDLFNTEHLWFLTYLWTYTIALTLAVVLFPDRWKARLTGGLRQLTAGTMILTLPIVAIVFLRMSMIFVIPESGNVLTDWHGHVTVVPAFLLGFALAGAPWLWSTILRVWRHALAISLVCLAVLLWGELAYPGDATAPHLQQMLLRSASAAMSWSMIILLAGMAQRWLRRDHWSRPLLAEAVFPFYLIHQTIIVVVGWELRPLGLPSLAEFAIILAATVAGCFAFYCLGREIGWLRPLIGLQGVATPLAPHMRFPRSVALRRG